MGVRRPAAVRGPRRVARLLAVAVVALVGVVLVPQAFAGTFTVTNTSDSGPGSLRQAILDANAAPGSQINFTIGTGVQKIIVGTPLPVITSPVVINGLSQPGINPPDIVLDGSQCGIAPPCDGLVVSGGSTIEGLAVVGFSGRGIVFDGSQTELGANKLKSSFVGWSPANAGFSGNKIAGVAIVNSPNNQIGDGTAAGRVLIGGNGGGAGNHAEILITGSSTLGNTVSANWLGLAPDGTSSADTLNGVVITNGAHDNTIGGKDTVGNLIYAFGQDAIDVQSAGSGNVIAGNSIGLGKRGRDCDSDTGIGVTAARTR